MIDIESMVFDKVKGVVTAAFPKATVESSYVSEAASFPFVSLYESDNAVYSKTQSLSDRENHAAVTYECNVYTTGSRKKEQSKKLTALIDETMQDIGFTRQFQSQTPNVDRTIYRITTRFTAVVSKGVKQPDGGVRYYIFKQ